MNSVMDRGCVRATPHPEDLSADAFSRSMDRHAEDRRDHDRFAAVAAFLTLFLGACRSSGFTGDDFAAISRQAEEMRGQPPRQTLGVVPSLNSPPSVEPTAPQSDSQAATLLAKIAVPPVDRRSDGGLIDVLGDSLTNWVDKTVASVTDPTTVVNWGVQRGARWLRREAMSSHEQEFGPGSGAEAREQYANPEMWGAPSFRDAAYRPSESPFYGDIGYYFQSHEQRLRYHNFPTIPLPEILTNKWSFRLTSMRVEDVFDGRVPLGGTVQFEPYRGCSIQCMYRNHIQERTDSFGFQETRREQQIFFEIAFTF